MNNLRPKKLDDIIGQETVVDRLRISCSAAIQRGDALPHILINGQPGLGKTSMACAIANEMERPIILLNAGNINTIKDIVPTLLKVEKNEVVFIDETHRLNIRVEEFLYTVFEDFRMDIGGDKVVSMNLPAFTLIGATTLGGALSRPLYDRFTYHFDLDLYDTEAILEILRTNAPKVGLTIEDPALKSLADRCRGTPRHANNYLTWLRDFTQSKGQSLVTLDIVEDGMRMLGIDEQGITEQDRKYLEILRRSGRPMGVATLVGATGFDRETIEQVIEPYLLRLRIIEKTPRGRVLV